MFLLAVWLGAMMLGRIHGGLLLTTEGPISGGPLPEPPTQLDGCCFSALKVMLDHVAAHQTEWDSCERSQLDAAQGEQERIGGRLADLQAKLSTESLPENKTNVAIPRDFIRIGSKYYYIEQSNRQNWYGAANTCRQMGGHLVSLESRKEQSDIEKHLKHMEVYWLDSTDLATEGTFVHMSTGKPARFLNWGYGEPDNHGNFQHCNFLYNGYYYDSHCNTKCLFICQAGNEI
ncbi:C-type lectin 37Db-like [Drosophila ficusphila]|uniref:C-type lectin 37Db-like n=1 Tax=Drosophila ficusphila TaxID=30025 RepID=UPI0007E5E401|nr:C-type lectin 37Db-like [Drosophila ficusphila]